MAEAPKHIEPTGEVAGEGGSPGDVEIHHRPQPASGSEATETVRRRPVEQDEVDRGAPGNRRHP